MTTEELRDWWTYMRSNGAKTLPLKDGSTLEISVAVFRRHGGPRRGFEVKGVGFFLTLDEIARWMTLTGRSL